MAFDPYSSCPCGSGKKFKWCCQPIHQEMAKAFQLDEQGQHESALRVMDEVVAAHADNPEAWGKKALLLWQNEKPEEAEAALTKAFEVDPKYPFGHYLRARFRLFEGEIPGALLLFRKAAEVYDPGAREILAEIYINIFDCEMKLNRPVAAHAAGELAKKSDPNNTQLKESLDAIFSDKNPNLPPSAKKAYTYRPTRKVGQKAWDAVMAKMAGSRLHDVQRAFAELAKADPEDPSVWFNLGITQAWLGTNNAALESLERYIVLEPDDTLAAEAETLGDILRCGQGMEDQADYVEHSMTAQLRDPQGFVNQLAKLEQEHVLAGLRLDEEQRILVGVVLEPAPIALTAESQAKQAPGLGAFFMLAGTIVRLWNTSAEKVEAAFKLLREKTGAALTDGFPARGPAKFQDVIAPAMVMPIGAGSQESHDEIVHAAFGRYYEDTWIHKPLKSLGNVPPIDAAGSAILRKKLLGAIRFQEEIANRPGAPVAYDFDRLRRKLNLITGAGAPAAVSNDIGAMGAAELAALAIDKLDDGKLEQAFRTATQVDAKELAAKFAEAIVSRPANAGRPDRYPWYNYLVNHALSTGDSQAALNHVDAGESHDCSHNEGKRRNAYELRRGQVLLKKGDAAAAVDVLTKLVARTPDDLDLRGKVVEALLSAKQGESAKKLAEESLELAKKQNNRDREGQFAELADAAKRL